SCFCELSLLPSDLHSFPTRRSSDLIAEVQAITGRDGRIEACPANGRRAMRGFVQQCQAFCSRCRAPALAEQRERGNRQTRHQCRSEEHTSELQSPDHLVCRLLLEKK